MIGVKNFKLFLIGFFGITLIFTACKHLEKEQPDAMDPIFLDLSIKYNNAIKLFSFYHRISKFHIVDTSSIMDNKFNKKRIGDVVKNDAIALWFNENSCSSCYNKELKLLKEIYDEEGYGKVFVFVSGLKERRAFQYLCQELRMDNSIYFIDSVFFADDFLSKNEIPFIFKIDKFLNIKNITLLDKSLPGSLSNESIEVIKASLTRINAD